MIADTVNLYTIGTGAIVPAGPDHCPGEQGSVQGFPMLESRRDAQRRFYQVALKDGQVLCDGVERAYADGYARSWNRLIDRAESSAYIQPSLVSIGKPQGRFDAQHTVQFEGASSAGHGGEQGAG